MSDLTTFLITSLFSSAALTAALLWLSKSWISERLKNAIAHEYGEKLESHKALLKAQSDVEIERLRSQLSRTATEHQVRFAGLHSKRADVIAEAYDLLVRAYWDGSSFASPAQFAGEPSKEEKYATSMKSITDFYRFFDRHRLYLPPAICEKVDPLIDEMRSKVHMYGTYLSFSNQHMTSETTMEQMTAWREAWEFFKDKVPVARAALEAELRILLGDDVPS